MQPFAAISPASPTRGIVPALRYRDVRAAVDWLCLAFGFEKHRILADDDGSIRFAQLSYGPSMIMLCPIGGTALDAHMVQPSDTGGLETQVCYVHVADAQAHQARARAAGAEIVLDLECGEGKGRGYTCRDLEGHAWSFGTYDPWRLAEAAAAPAAAPARPGRRLAGAAAAVLAGVFATMGLVNWVHGAADPGIAATLASIEDVLEKPADLEGAEQLLRQVRTELMRERSARMQAERSITELKDATAREREERQRAERALEDARSPSRVAGLARNAEPLMFPAGPPLAVQPPKCVADATVTPVRVAGPAGLAVGDEIKALRRAMEQAEAQLQQERQARETSALGTKEAREQLARERIAREMAERQAREAVRRAVRIEAARRAEFVRRNGGGGIDDYRDVAKIVFPPS